MQGIAKILDKLAGVCFFGVMLLIIGNIFLRGILGRPILGTYEIVGFLTAWGIGLALAHCALQDGHIAVGIFMERLSQKIQSFVAVLVNAASFVFWSAAAWYLFQFGQAMKVKGLVSPSAEIPVYPVIYL
jgi:TRAP-type C4-dicarboxylate transport system permease small subunit